MVSVLTKKRAKLYLEKGVNIDLIIADTFFSRLRGVYGLRLSWNEALWIKPCNAIHTFFCHPLGAVFLDRDNCVVQSYPWILPNNILVARKSVSVIEYPVGSPLSGLKLGDKLFINES